ncbi:MAG TPA: hypothetical protein VHX39_19240, partial [Acetobacteraceae bacterium]|nr:hypothetical protein [Acetobacteraceae bacterium]
MGQDVAQERNVGGNPLQPELGERSGQPRHRGSEIGLRRMRDHLGQQRIERARGAIPGIAEPVGAHTRTVRRLIDAQ